ncbi:MAG: bifunctional diaminohydroxyphosphoribosylaminopyrimidine deaminase/5-amino-6-(5-phosphoribosylamino)uracil reductase RibD [Selenomonadaceae bacterium]
MQQALQIAAYAAGRTSPNPLVGAVIVKDGRVVGQGWHRKAGTEHAEIHALRQAGELAAGATIYVTLEPCSHYGRTGPCSKALIDARIKRVVIAMLDPNPLVAGKGVAMLKAAGIEVETGLLQEQAERLNEVFLKWIMTKMPFTVMKTAMTLDGKIATAAGNSKWISNEVSRRRVHELRDVYDGILVGIGTVLADDPALTTRLASQSGKNPLRIVVDSRARTPLTAKVVTDGQAETLIAVTVAAEAAKVEALRQAGVEVLVVNDGQQVDLKQLFCLLGERGVCSIFVEGGARINYSLLKAGLVDKVYTFIAPKMVGGSSAPGPVGGDGVETLDQAFLLENVETELLAGDILVSGYINRR